MVEALTGWLGLAILVLAAVSALAADGLRQRFGGADVTPPRRQRRWVAGLTIAAALLAALGAASTLLRFAVLT